MNAIYQKFHALLLIKQFYSFFSETVTESAFVPRVGAQMGEDTVPRAGGQLEIEILPPVLSLHSNSSPGWG